MAATDEIFLSMAERVILIRGGGIAACCCARLLQQQAFSPALDETKRPTLPAILLSRATQKLLEDIFQTKDLFAGLTEIRRRVVAWGEADPVVLPHSAIVVSEQTLLNRLWARIAGISNRRPASPDWTIITAKPAEVLPAEMHFGTRHAFVREVELRSEAQRDACWIESVEDGWLFLLPTGADRGSLISVGARTEPQMEKSRLVASQILRLGTTARGFAAYPRILTSLCAAGWLTCGTAAMSLDPLCGEGAGNAAREAILACAALRAICDGESADEVFAEYSLRLLLGFYRHLENCKKFYRKDSPSAFWSSELSLLEDGIVWTKKQLREVPRSRFRLAGFSLERIASAGEI